jgi:hypothetical protein
MKTIIIILMFLLIGAFLIVNNGNFHLSKSSDFNEFGNLYYNWLKQISSNTAQITGNIINIDWLPKEQKLDSSK